MAEVSIKEQEEALKQRADLLLKDIGSKGIEAFELGSAYLQKAHIEGQDVGMFVMKRKIGVNEHAVESDLRARATVPLDKTGRIVITDIATLPWAGIRTFLTPTAIGGPQRQVHDWHISPSGVSGGLLRTDEKTKTSAIDDEMDELLKANSGDEILQVRVDGTYPNDEVLRSAVSIQLAEQLQIARRLGDLLGKYLQLTDFSDIY